MRRRRWHAKGYHEWPRETLVLDAVAAIVSFASVIIGAYATLFLLAALRDRDGAVARENVAILVAVAAANVVVEGVRRWRRHHG